MKALSIARISLGTVACAVALFLSSSTTIAKVQAGTCSGNCAAGGQCVIGSDCYCCNVGGCTGGYSGHCE
jgi:hypothetical protein